MVLYITPGKVGYRLLLGFTQGKGRQEHHFEAAVLHSVISSQAEAGEWTAT